MRFLDVLSRSRRAELLDQLDIGPDDLEQWREISTRTCVPFHDDGLVSQFAGYEQIEELDWEAYRERYGDLRRIDWILESEGDTVFRYKVSKQADVLMLVYLLPFEVLQELLAENGYHFDEEMLRRNMSYYEQRTSHGSTLSGVVHAWIDLRWKREDAWSRFETIARLDLPQEQARRFEEGIHLAATGGAADLVQRCEELLSSEADP